MSGAGTHEGPERLGLFAGYGIEIELMIVDQASGDVRPLAEHLLREAGEVVGEVERGALAWSNELVAHVIELKTNGPAPSLAGLETAFQHDVQRINAQLAPLGAQLLPGGVHPRMQPERETTLWPYGQKDIYEAYDRIFGCRGHGWSNLQSVHLNLPFADDHEFALLHGAIRLLLPLLPALSAASPVLEGRWTGLLDTRLEVYRKNQARIAAITGLVVPEPVASAQAYETQILQPMYRAVAPLDPAGLLQHEWLNSRGAIARFDRHAIEIRVLDTQECPAADIAIASAIVSVLRGLIDEGWLARATHQQFATETLASLFEATLRDGERTVVRDPAYLALWPGGTKARTAGELWQLLLARWPLTAHTSTAVQDALQTLLTHGPLGRRMLSHLGLHAEAAPVAVDDDALRQLEHRLAHCLARGETLPPA